MKIAEQVRLSTLTTFRAGGPAAYAATCESVEDIAEAVAFVERKELPFTALGEGSNVLAADEGYAGVLLLIRIPGLSFEERGDSTLLHAGAGVSWEELVHAATLRGLWGIENLAGIPGTAGAAPVQNIGAYGAELQDTLQSVHVYDTKRQVEERMPASECGFGYRESRFKHEPNLIITGITLSLSSTGNPNCSYPDLRTMADSLTTPCEVAAAVRTIRSRKFPDLSKVGTAGSFFKNPIISEEEYAALVAQFGAIPRFPASAGVKVPLAFFLDTVLGLRGYERGAAALFAGQPLVLTLAEGGTAKEVNALAEFVETEVARKTGIHIMREVRSL